MTTVMATVVMAVIATVVMAVMVTVVTAVAGVVVVTRFIQERLHVFSIQKLAVLATNSSESSLHRVIGSIPEPALQALDVALQSQLSFDDGDKGVVLVTRQVSAFASFTRGTLQSGSLEVIVLTGEQHWLESEIKLVFREITYSARVRLSVSTLEFQNLTS